MLHHEGCRLFRREDERFSSRKNIKISQYMFDYFDGISINHAVSKREARLGFLGVKLCEDLPERAPGATSGTVRENVFSGSHTDM
jgi:hypothetical protein